MPTTIYTSKDASAIQATTYNWNGTDLHHPVGRMYHGVYLARSVIYFPISFTGVTSVESAVLWLRGSKSGASHCYGDSSSKTMYVRRQTRTWGEDTSTSEGVWTNRTWDFTTLSSYTTNGQATKVFSSGIVDGTWYSIDVTDIVNAWKSGSANYGFVLINSNEASGSAGSTDGIEFYSREKGSAYRPYLVLTTSTNNPPNAPTSLTPTGDAVVSSLHPYLRGTFSDPDAGDSISGFQILVYNDAETTVLWDQSKGTEISPFLATYQGDPLDWGTFYKWKARVKDQAGAWGPWSSLKRFQTIAATPPPIITGLSATVLSNSIDLSWDVSTLVDADFDHYLLYRRELGDSEWLEHASIFDKASTIFSDLAVSFGVTYEYKITQFKNIEGGFDIESDDSDIVEASLEGEGLDIWMVIGADGKIEHTFELPVISERHQNPIQQEVFEPLGSNRKTVARGRVLGIEGSLTCKWDTDERDEARTNLRYIVNNRGPHVLRSPFGDSWLVEFGGPEYEYEPLGHLTVNLQWTEVA